MAQPSLFVLVPGFGGPHIEHKIQILENNIQKITSGPWASLVIRICVYDHTVFQHVLPQHPSLQWVVKPGIVGQYIHEFAQPDAIPEDTKYVMILLDDVELQHDVDLSKIVRYIETFNFDILSPTMTRTSKYQYSYMLQEPDGLFDIKVTAACEAFCYFMKKCSYKKYYELIDPKQNPWLWGIDLCMHRFHGFTLAMCNKMTIHHYYKNECYEFRPDQDPHQGFLSLLEKYNTTKEEMSRMKAVHYVIFDTTGL